MFDNQTKKFCSAVVDALPEISEEVMQGWIGNPKALQKVLREGLCPSLSGSMSLLTPLTPVITVPASDEPFVARDHFRVDTTSEAELPISYLGHIFREKFLAKIEPPSAGTNLRPRRLNQSSVDGPIIKALGAEDKAETTLREMHHFLKLADRTKWHIFYIMGVDNSLWAVGAGWLGDGWDVGARSVGYPGRWGGGHLVVARD